jgi:hypothetical protein
MSSSSWSYKRSSTFFPVISPDVSKSRWKSVIVEVVDKLLIKLYNFTSKVKGKNFCTLHSGSVLALKEEFLRRLRADLFLN